MVGASSGIGEALARRLAARGRRVALLARRVERLEEVARGIDSGGERARAYGHDVRRREEVEGLFDRIEAELGTVDELYYVAAVMPEIGADEYDTEKDALQVEVNMLGCIAWGNAAARRFQERGAGRIVGVSSVAQDRGRTGRPVYGASKAGMDHYLEALRNRLWRRGVTVTTVRPGYVDTPMTQGHPKLFWLIGADRCAELIVRAAERRRTIVYVPARWRLLMTVIRCIPSFVFRKLDI